MAKSSMLPLFVLSLTQSNLDSAFVLCRLSSAAYAALACLAVEYIGLFLGVSLFLRGHNCLYILLHFAGAIVTGLMYTQVGQITAAVQHGCFATGQAFSHKLLLLCMMLSCGP